MVSDTNQNASSDTDDVIIEKWAPTVAAITSATRKAFPSSPQSSTSRDEFRQYWYDTFTQLLETVAADSAVPGHLTSPPVNRFIIKLFDKPHGLCCPCLMPEVEPTITLENEQGVSKLDLVRVVRDYLYGAEVPDIYLLLVNKFGCEESDVLAAETPLVYKADWMSAGSDEAGDRVSYYDHTPQLFMYCCPSDEFMEKGDKEAAEEDKQGRKGKSNRV